MKIVKAIFLLAVAPLILGAPYVEDDEYDDDPELADRKETAQHLLEEEEQASKEVVATSSAPPSTTTPTTPLPYIAPVSPTVNPFGPKQWVHAKDVKGYHILSDGPPIFTEFVKTRPMLKIRINIPDTVRDVEKSWHGQDLELKIRNWNRIDKVHIKVPIGYERDDLKVSEQRDHVAIMAPILSDIDESQLTFE